MLLCKAGLSYVTHQYEISHLFRNFFPIFLHHRVDASFIFSKLFSVFIYLTYNRSYTVFSMTIRNECYLRKTRLKFSHIIIIFSLATAIFCGPIFLKFCTLVATPSTNELHKFGVDTSRKKIYEQSKHFVIGMETKLSYSFWCFENSKLL